MIKDGKEKKVREMRVKNKEKGELVMKRLVKLMI